VEGECPGFRDLRTLSAAEAAACGVRELRYLQRPSGAVGL